MISLPKTKPQPAANRAQRQKVAVVLNGNAKAVTDRVIHDLRQVVQDESLFISTSLDQARFIARHIVNKGFDVVLCGGGDGTFTQCLTDIISLQPRRQPAMGVLRLGTGNALANVLGASAPNLKGLITDLRRAREAEARFDLALLRVEGKVAPFAGVGLDSLILSDYNAHKELLAGTPLSPLGQGSAGYALSIATRSLWRFLREPRPKVVIRNEGVTAWRMDLQGRPFGQPVPKGGILYSGPVAIAAASTIPFYGLGLRLFPQAGRRSDRFQLRVGDVDPFSVLTQLPALFRGELDAPGIHDYFCTAISIHLRRPTPFQVGGDEVGRRTSVQIGLTKVLAVRGGLGLAAYRDQDNVVSIPRGLRAS